MTHVPELVRSFFEKFDPKVWKEHGQSIIEADSAILNSAAQSGHA
jgi:hypothetical protein